MELFRRIFHATIQLMPASVVARDGVASLMASANTAIQPHSPKEPVLTRPILSMLVWEVA